MTRTHVDESELVKIGQDAITLYNALVYLAKCRRGDSDREEMEDLAADARELSDQVDALCEFVRHSRMVDGKV